MVRKKGDLQKDLAKMLGQAKVKFKKFGKELNVLAKKSEKEIVKASKSGKIQIDIMSLAVQKEKLYYDIGKKTASLKAKKKIGIRDLEPYWERMRKIERSVRNKKKELSDFRKAKASRA